MVPTNKLVSFSTLRFRFWLWVGESHLKQTASRNVTSTPTNNIDFIVKACLGPLLVPRSPPIYERDHMSLCLITLKQKRNFFFFFLILCPLLHRAFQNLPIENTNRSQMASRKLECEWQIGRENWHQLKKKFIAFKSFKCISSRPTNGATRTRRIHEWLAAKDTSLKSMMELSNESFEVGDTEQIPPPCCQLHWISKLQEKKIDFSKFSAL